MLAVPLAVQLSITKPEIGREVYDQPGSRPEQPSDRLRALAMPVGDEGHVKVGGLYLLGCDIRSLDGELRINLADLPSRIPARRNPERPDLGVPGEQPNQIHPRIPTTAINTHAQSHAAHCRTSGYLFKFLHKLVDAFTRGCDNMPP